MRMMNGRGGRKASESHSSLSLDMSLSKALNPSTTPVNQQRDEWLLLGSSREEYLCNCKTVPTPCRDGGYEESKEKEKSCERLKGEEVRGEGDFFFFRVDQRLPRLDVCTLLGMKPCLSDGGTEL